MAESLDPLRLLQEDLKDDDYEQAMASIKRLGTIALALGPTRTRNELLPFLHEYCEGDNDEGQTAIADQLGDFVDLIGGPNHATALLPLLEKLCGEEECVVRNTAVQSLIKLVSKIPKNDVATKFVPLIRRLANGDWFTTRVSACALFVCAYPSLSEQLQTELRELFNNLCNDDTPMVRKAAFKQVGHFSLVVQRNFFKSELLPIIKTQIAEDDLDSMRLFTIDCCVILAGKIDANEYTTLLLPVVDGLQDDASWRVRKELSEKMPYLCQQLGEPITSKRLIPLFAKLMKDKEAEVRSAACGCLSELCANVKSGAGLVEHIVPVLESLAVDPVQNVRLAFSKNVLALTKPLGKELVPKHLMPLVQQLAKDEHHEVRNNIIETIDDLADSVGPANITAALLPAIIELSKDPKWRVRQAIINKTALLAKHLGVKAFEKKLHNIMIVSLSDHVFSIREICCDQIGKVVQLFGGKWATEKLFPSAFAIYDKTTNYLHRMTCLLLITNAAPQCGKEIVEKSLLPIVLNACIDDVANVRIAAAKTLLDVIPRVDKAIATSKIKPALQKLVKDTDEDVQYFSGLSLALCE